MRTQDSSNTNFEVYYAIEGRIAMERKKQSWWNYWKYDTEPRRGNVLEPGKCLAAIETSFDGINPGTNEGKACWAVTGPCRGEDVHRLRKTDRHDSYRTDQAFRLAPEL